MDGYFHVSIANKSVHKMVFSSRYGMFEYLVMLLGLKNVLNIFLRVMNQVLFDLLDSSVIIYLNNILVFSNTKKDCVYDLNAAFRRL